jgi:hypothetical protein
MLRKICNYLAVIALCLAVGGTSVLAKVNTKTEYKKIFVDDQKDFSFYNELIRADGKHAYQIKVEAGKEAKIKIRSLNGVALKIQSPDGQITENTAERYFEVNLSAEGEYLVEIESLYLSRYSMEISSK